jgi:hypothetical protein
MNQERLFCALVAFPFVETIGGDQAAPFADRIPKCGRLADGLGTGVAQTLPDFS